MEEREYNGLADASTTSAAVESQSSQLLDFVLGRADPPNAWSNAQAIAADNENTSVDRHSGSGSSGEGLVSSASGTRYHFHGLATTQTQLVGGEDSQKENAPTQTRDRFQSVPPTVPVPAPPSASGTKSASDLSRCVPASLPSPLTPSRALSTSAPGPLSSRVPQQTKVVSFVSPARPVQPQKAPSNTHSMRFRRRRSPSLSSQDSFAGPSAFQDPDLFVATSKVFERPLEELGESYSQEQMPVRQQHEEEQEGSVDNRLGKRSAGSVETRGYSLSHSSSAGRILVANSDSSGTSQDSLQRNSGDGFDISLSQQATQLLGSADSSMSSAQNVATQIVGEPSQHNPTQEATQPASFTEQDVAEDRNRVGTAEATESSVVESSIATAPRSILSLVAPEKRHRYMHHFGEHNVEGHGAVVSQASCAATAGSGKSTLPKPGPTPDEEVVPDSEQQVELDLTPAVTKPIATKSMDREVIPPSESDVPDASMGDEQEETEDEAEEDGPFKVPTKPISRALAKGKQKEEPPLRGRGGTFRKPPSVEAGKLPLAAPARAPLVPSPLKSPAVAAPAKVRAGTSAKKSTAIPPVKASGVAPKVIAAVPFAKVRGGQKNAAAENVEMDLQSEPEQLPPVRRSRGRPRGLARGKGKERKDASAEPLPVKTTALVPKRRVTRAQTPALAPNANTLEDEEDEEDSPAIPLAQVKRMEEEETEIADDEFVDENMYEEQPIVKPEPSPRKRKRVNATALAVKKAGKGKAVATTTTKKTATRTIVTGQPPAKRPRTSASSAPPVTTRFGAGIGTQVFALYKADSSYYGADVYTLNGTRAHVKYFDGLEDPNLGVTQMRKFMLKKGDTVFSGGIIHKATVIDDSLWDTENEVRAQYTEGPEEGLEFVVEADNVRISARSIQSQWRDRTLELSEIIPVVGRRPLKDTPSPSKMSVLSTAMSTKAVRNKTLAKYAFVVTLGPGNTNWAREKDRIVSMIKDSGGTVLGDWLDIFSLQGKHTNANKRWTILREDVQYVPRDKGSAAIDRVFLVANVFNQKPKFLLALALGIPCVSNDWLEKLTMGEDASWKHDLLPAGHSEPLGASVSQTVDLDWGCAIEHLTEIMENKVPHKILANTSVLCVGADLLPLPAKKTATAADRSLEASRTVPRIIVCMGAARVEAVADVKHASKKDLTQYDYVVVKEALPSPLVQDATYVDVTWIKECLIAGRLLPLPEWN
ncbi:hypothetical protein DFH11DRAFT_1852350 [Phellopilus nigrolimitatus]|nr:hypothetical protein DFH11DRAFT_1852350 [Phellopilus nigrolimitatus]